MSARPWITALLVTLSLALAIPAGIATAKGRSIDAAVGSVGVVVVLVLTVTLLMVNRLMEIRKLQETGLRLGQILGTVAMLGAFGLAVFVVFFIACAKNVHFSY